MAFAFHVFNGLFGLVAQAVGLIANFNGFFAFFIRFGVGFGFFNKTVNFVFIKRAGRSNGDFLFFAGAEVFSFNVYDAVSVDIEGNFDFRYSARCKRNTGQFKAAEGKAGYRNTWRKSGIWK